MSSSLNPRKRSLSDAGIEDLNPSPIKKARSNLEGNGTFTLCRNIAKITQDRRVNDVKFIVKWKGKTQRVDGVKLCFAAQSKVFANMLLNGNMRESKESTVIIEDVTFESFQFIKEYTHCLHPTLPFQHVVDILYAAQKYLIYELIQECEAKILSLDGPKAFYAVITAINKYATSVFEGLLAELTRSEYVQFNVINILQWTESNKMLNKLSVQQMIMLIDNVNDHQVRYIFCKKYCEFAAGKEWRYLFTAHFKQIIAFRLLSIYFLGQTVGKDRVLSYDEFIALISSKTECEWLYGREASPNFSGPSSPPHHTVTTPDYTASSPPPSYSQYPSSPPHQLVTTPNHTASSPIYRPSLPTSPSFSFSATPPMSPISTQSQR